MNRENEPRLEDVVNERDPGGKQMQPAEDYLGAHLHPKLTARAREWWELECPEDVKSKCSIWIILALFASYLKDNPENYEGMGKHRT